MVEENMPVCILVSNPQSNLNFYNLNLYGNILLFEASYFFQLLWDYIILIGNGFSRIFDILTLILLEDFKGYQRWRDHNSIEVKQSQQ